MIWLFCAFLLLFLDIFSFYFQPFVFRFFWTFFSKKTLFWDVLFENLKLTFFWELFLWVRNNCLNKICVRRFFVNLCREGLLRVDLRWRRQLRRQLFLCLCLRVILIMSYLLLYMANALFYWNISFCLYFVNFVGHLCFDIGWVVNESILIRELRLAKIPKNGWIWNILEKGHTRKWKRL